MILESSDQNVRSLPAGWSTTGRRGKEDEGYYPDDILYKLSGGLSAIFRIRSRARVLRYKMQSQLFRLLCLDGNFSSIVHFWKARDDPPRDVLRISLQTT